MLAPVLLIGKKMGACHPLPLLVMAVGMIPNTWYVTFEFLMHASFVADEILGFMLEPARSGRRKRAT